MILKAFSKGLYSNWYFYAPDRVLLDCGEGVSLYLKTGIFAVEKIFLSHGHMDHIAGLQSLICLRQSTKGDNLKPLVIHYPEGDRSIRTLRDALSKMTRHFIKYPLEWVAMRDGDRFELRKGRVLETFSVDHRADDPMGFRIIENRKRLKPALVDVAGPDLAKIPVDEKFDYYDANLLSYSGDSMPIAPELCRNAQVLIHDATFLKAADRNAPQHASAQEVFDLAREADVQRVVLCHISPRYAHDKVVKRLLARLNTHQVPFDWIGHDRLFEL